MRLVRIDWEDTIEHQTGWYEQEDIEDLEPPPLVIEVVVLEAAVRPGPIKF